MRHDTWKAYSSGELSEGDLIQLEVKSGTVTMYKCPVCTCFLSKGAETECPRCLSRFQRRPYGYRLMKVGERP